MEAARRSRTGRRGRVVNRVSQSKPSTSKPIQCIEALKSQPEALTVEDLKKIGNEVARRLRDGGKERICAASSGSFVEIDGGDAENPRPLLETGLEAAALLTSTCSVRPANEQEAVLGVQDKVLAGLRGLLGSLTPDLYRPTRAALLSLVAQPSFIKKRGGCRQHLVQALVEAASGPLPPSALSPVLRARETGPSVVDLTLEVLERVADGEPKRAVLELIHAIVGEVVASGTIKRGNKGAAKGTPLAHLMNFLIRACTVLPDNILLFSKELLALAESRWGSARKLSIVVLRLILERAGVSQEEVIGPALASVLRFARTDSDATVRSLAFDSVAEFSVGAYDGVLSHTEAGRREASLDQGDGSSAVNFEDGIPISATSSLGMPKYGAANYMTPDRRSPNDKNTHHGIQNHKATNHTTAPNHAPNEGTPDGGMSNEGTPNQETSNVGMSNEAKSNASSRFHAETMHPSGSHINDKEVVDQTDDLPNEEKNASKRHGKCRDETIADPWARGGVLFECLSASAEAALADGSKAVRVKALTCSLRILDAYKGNIQPEGVGKEFSSSSSSSSSIATILSKVVRGACFTLEAMANESSCGGAESSSADSSGAGKSRRGIDTVKALLSLPCVNPRPIDLLGCYVRCGEASGAVPTSVAAAAESKRALRDVVVKRFCGDIDSLLEVTSAVMKHEEDLKGFGAGLNNGNMVALGDERHLEGCSFGSLSGVLCELLSGVDTEVLTRLLEAALVAYTHMGDGVQSERRSVWGFLLAALRLKFHRRTALYIERVALKYLRYNTFCHCNRHASAGRTDAPVLLRTLALLGETKSKESQEGCISLDQARLLRSNQALFWGRLKQRMGDIEREGARKSGPGQQAGETILGPSCDDATEDRTSDMEVDEEVPRGGRREQTVVAGNGSTAVLECAELLRVFRLLATLSLLSRDGVVELESLVFPSALSRRRLIQPAVGLALALNEPHRVLLSSLAALQDATFSRSSTDVNRACDYVRLIGVLARENASFIAAHVRQQHSTLAHGKNFQGASPGEEQGDDYMAGVSNREAMEREIRSLCEASVTSDGMLSCYTPFLLAIAKCRAAESGDETGVQPSERDSEGIGAAGNHARCPPSLCAEALWALSEYAVLSPGLAATEVLPLAETLARSTAESPQVRGAAMLVLTRGELATDEIASSACDLLDDEDPMLRQQILRRLGSLMKESRIKTTHLSRFALLLASDHEGVRRTAETVFLEHLRPRPDAVCRCLFETYFTLDAEDAIKRRVLLSLVAVGKRAAPGRGRLESLGGTLMRKTADSARDSTSAAFFLSIVLPTVSSFDAAEIALRRGQLAQLPPETLSLVATHFTNGTRRIRSATSGEDVDEAQDVNSGGKDALPKAQALDMAQRIESLVTKHRASQATTTTDVVASKNSLAENSPKSRIISGRGKKDRRGKKKGFRTRNEAGHGPQKTAEETNSYGTRGTKRTLRARGKSSSNGGTREGWGYDKNNDRISMERGTPEEEEEAEWEG